MSVFRTAFLAFPTTLLLMACSRQPKASSAAHFAATPPVIDGQASEWSDSLRYDLKTKLQYQVLNDQRMVYVRLKAADPVAQAKIIRLGLVVWLDTTGRNQHQFGVRYPMGGSLAGRGPRAGAEGENEQADDASAAPTDRRANRRARMSLALAGMREMELLNYKGSKEPTLTDAQSQLGVKAAIAMDAQEDLVYELAVPLRLLYHKLPALSSGKVAVVGITLAGGQLAPTRATQAPSEYDTRGAGGMGGGGRGGYGGGGGRG
ncbi:MAG: hypothetical protein M3Y54_09265, partial [Bacteroidota bacterium]|nr:hypothetical protein [Bacteroidota bacterium]